MNLLSLCKSDGIELKRVASTKGGEHAGPCPWCGGQDRFRVWPEEGRFWCRSCGKKGDDIQYAMERRNLSFPEACRFVGREYKLNGGFGGRGQTSQGNAKAGSAARPAEIPERWTPQDLSLPGELWQEQAGKLVEYAAGNLNTDAWAYLNGRGLADDTIQARRLGLWPKDKYLKRSLWGLPESGKDLWIPAGIVIPYFIKGQVVRLRIRRNEGEPRYVVVSGSSMVAMALGEKDIMVVVESELDGFLLCQDCGDMAGIIALGNAQTRPDTGTAAMLGKAKLILMALDTDQAGAAASWRWWPQHFPQARRWPPIRGKDPGEMWQAGVNLREWVEAGIEYYQG